MAHVFTAGTAAAVPHRLGVFRSADPIGPSRGAARNWRAGCAAWGRPGSGAELAWRRYSSFRHLRQKLKAGRHAVPEIDGKRLFNNKHERVLAKRRSSLGLLLQFIVEQGIAGESEFCGNFFELHIEENEETGDSDSFLFKWSGVCY